MTLRLITAGESHGPSLTRIVEGLPAACAWTVRILSAIWRAASSVTVAAGA